MVILAVPIFSWLSATWTVNAAEPAVVGVPVIAPVPLPSVKPAGSVPPLIDHV
jgi:hypothetical protein